jgi:YjbE family integral membrane protein
MWSVGMGEFLTFDALSTLAQVILIDLVLAGDNAIVIGLVVAGLAPEHRGKAVLIGIAVATVLRICFTAITTQLLQIIGLMLAGGILLLWVCWKMWRELRTSTEHKEAAVTALENTEASAATVAAGAGAAPQKTLAQASWQIIIADLSMSLDNVLAVAGTARDHPWVLVFGLLLSIALMGIAAIYIARLLNKYRWIAYVGLALILYVALDMIYHGALDTWPVVSEAIT